MEKANLTHTFMAQEGEGKVVPVATLCHTGLGRVLLWVAEAGQVLWLMVEEDVRDGDVLGTQRAATSEASGSNSRSDTSREGQGSVEAPPPRARGCTAAILLSSAGVRGKGWSMSGHKTALIE